MTIVRYIMMFGLILSTLNGQSKVELSMLIRSDGVWYLRDSTKPFSGIAYVLYDNSKRNKESKYSKGQLHGVHNEWWENGKKKKHGRYKKGKRHGRWVKYYENGKIQLESTFKNGIKDGVIQEWHENGMVHYKGEYDQGERLGSWEYWDDLGRLIQYACIQTKFGEIIIDLYEDVAPIHVKNFKDLIRTGYYDQTIFHRVIPDFIIQGGDPNSRLTNRKIHGKGGTAYSYHGVGERKNSATWRLPAEFNDNRHERGMVSMARGPDENSAGSQFFICVKDSPNLDNRYTIFGRVLEGMDIVDKIVTVPVDFRDNPIDRIEMDISICN